MKNDRYKYELTVESILRIPALDYGEMCRMLEDKVLMDNFIRSEIFQEALFYASPDLYSELIKFLDGKLNKKESDRLRDSVIKYLERMGTRCTPFASFAACGIVDIGEKCNMSFSGAFKNHFRYDMQFLCLIAERLLKNDIDVYRGMRYKKNPTLFKVGGFCKYDSQSYSNGIQSYSIKSTPILNAVLRMACRPIGYKHLEESVKKKFDIDSEAFLNYVFKLGVNGILVDDLTPEVVGFGYFDKLCALSEYSNNKQTKSYFKFLKDSLRELNSKNGFAEKRAIFESLYSRSKEFNLPVSRKSVIQVDSTFFDSGLCFPSKLAEDILGYISLYNKLTPKFVNARLQNFIKRYENRYESQTVPLVEVLNPEVGIGYEGTSIRRIPLLDDLIPSHQTRVNDMSRLYLTPFQKILLNKLCEYGSSRHHELIITDEDLMHIPDNTVDDLPLSMAAMFKIVGHENGEFLIGGLHFAGNSAINMLSRFCDSDERLSEFCKTLADKEQDVEGETILCEISHISQPRTGNVLLRPRMRDNVINYLTAPSECINEISLSDIFITVNKGRIVLSLKDGRKIEPRLTNAHNFNGNTSSVYKFLCEMQSQGLRAGLSIGWGGLETVISHLPRIRYKNLIISYEKWILDVKQFSTGGKYNMSKFREYCNHIGVCRKVRFVEGDNTLYVDVENDSSVKAFFSAIKKSLTLTFEEFLPIDDKMDYMGIAPINECIVPLIKVKNEK